MQCSTGQENTERDMGLLLKIDIIKGNLGNYKVSKTMSQEHSPVEQDTDSQVYPKGCCQHLQNWLQVVNLQHTNT